MAHKIQLRVATAMLQVKMSVTLPSLRWRRLLHIWRRRRPHRRNLDKVVVYLIIVAFAVIITIIVFVGLDICVIIGT